MMFVYWMYDRVDNFEHDLIFTALNNNIHLDHFKLFGKIIYQSFLYYYYIERNKMYSNKFLNKFRWVYRAMKLTYEA
jgi:hypothetical protein